MRAFTSISKIGIMLLWSIFCIIIATIVYVFTLFKKKIPVYLAGHMWAPVTLRIMGAKLKIEGAENCEPGKHYVIISNHSSYLDIPILFRALPVNIHFIGKKELRRVPFLGWYMNISGMIFIDRRNAKKAKASIESATNMVRKGHNVVIFPEGTTTVDLEIGAFKKGAFVMAKESESPILPVRIIGSNLVWPADSSTNIRPNNVTIRIGKAIEYSEFADKDLRTNMAETREIIRNL